MEIKCRCCLMSTYCEYYSLLAVLPAFGRSNSSILDLLATVTSSQVTFSDDLPKEICQSCLTDLETAYRFILLFRESQRFLQEQCDLNQKTEEADNEDTSGEDFETIIIKEGESEDCFEDSTETEEIVIFSEVDKNLEELVDEEDYSISDADDVFKGNSEPDLPESLKQTVSEVFDDETKDSTETLSAENNDGNINFKMKELIEMERNREKNKQNIIIMTVEDVLKGDRQKSREEKVVLSVEDVIKARKRSRSEKDKSDETINVFMCDICKKVFSTRRRMWMHKYNVHNPNWKEKFRCSICKTACKTSSALKHHMLKHSDDRFECYLCGRVYLVKQHLNVHIKQKHGDSSQTNYLCPHCGKNCRSSSAFLYHLRIHNNQRDYMCRYCGFMSLTQSGSERHERIHTGERPYSCRYCGKTFAGSPERQKHENVHKGVAPYKCQYCPKRFVQTYNMKVHMLRHGGDMECIICDKSFIDEDVLQFHYQRSHKEAFKEDTEDT